MHQSTLLATLQALEQSLLRAEVRSDSDRLGALLHPLFSEVGASGRTYSREEMLTEFRNAPPSYAVWAQDFQAEVISETVVLLRFKSAHIEESGSLSRFVSRISVWQATESGWRLRFHQGTPTTAFEKRAEN
jgi:hypothetical protein